MRVGGMDGGEQMRGRAPPLLRLLRPSRKTRFSQQAPRESLVQARRHHLVSLQQRQFRNGRRLRNVQLLETIPGPKCDAR